jgi:23S rRNA (uracil1939-C5)-methyltransferase
VRETVTIETIGHRGDGIVTTATGPLYVPFTLPGERVTVERQTDKGGERARAVEIIESSADRVTPTCRHFGRCGGCALQMLPLSANRDLKRNFVVAALLQRGLEPDVSETIGVAPASRRRAVLTAQRVEKRLRLGYRERLSHDVVDIEECPVLAPQVAAHLPDIRALADRLVSGKRPVRLTVLKTRTGLDIAIEGIAAPDAHALAALTRAAPRGVTRLSIGGEPVLTLAEPAIEIAGVALVPPPGAFIQASAEAEAAMTDVARTHLCNATRIADLFSGIGTFTFALARDAQLRAVESDGAMLDALSDAAHRASGLKPIKTERRDLFVHPLSPKELVAFDGVVFDPPRAGAKAQAEALAASTVPYVAAISCNPATFARDARILVDGGYRIERVVPIDQFVYSAETEVVGLFTRDIKRPGRKRESVRL